MIANDVVQAFPASPDQDIAVNRKPNAVLPAGPSQASNNGDSRNEAILRLANQFDTEGIAIRVVKASLIKERWQEENGPPPKVDAITRVMNGGQRGHPSKP